jgi:hypothetical protein
MAVISILALCGQTAICFRVLLLIGKNGNVFLMLVQACGFPTMDHFLHEGHGREVESDFVRVSRWAEVAYVSNRTLVSAGTAGAVFNA